MDRARNLKVEVDRSGTRSIKREGGERTRSRSPIHRSRSNASKGSHTVTKKISERQQSRSASRTRRKSETQRPSERALAQESVSEKNQKERSR